MAPSALQNFAVEENHCASSRAELDGEHRRQVNWGCAPGDTATGTRKMPSKRQRQRKKERNVVEFFAREKREREEREAVLLQEDEQESKSIHAVPGEGEKRYDTAGAVGKNVMKAAPGPKNEGEKATKKPREVVGGPKREPMSAEQIAIREVISEYGFDDEEGIDRRVTKLLCTVALAKAERIKESRKRREKRRENRRRIRKNGDEEKAPMPR